MRQVIYLVLLVIAMVCRMQAQITQGAITQIQSLQSEKAARSPAQRKMCSQLIYAGKMKRNQAIANGVPSLRVDLESDAAGRVKVDIEATVSNELLVRIGELGGEVISSVPKFRAIRAWLPLDQMEPLATRNDVTRITPAVKAIRNVGSVTSEGDATHLAAVARNQFGATGSGVKVGVLSDSVDFLATSQSLGDLGPVTVLPGQAGIGSGEGTAMLEIVHDIAPDAELFFATAFTSAASFAQNILDLAQAGCHVIVDDVFYLNESPFQDALIAQAVNSVTSAGVLYFSAAGNSGNKNDGSSGTWEGDFRDSGLVLTIDGQPSGRIHDLGGQTFLNRVTTNGLACFLFWSDPLGASSNDYDLYLVNSAGNTVIGASTSVQNGTQDPIESFGGAWTGEQIVIVLASGVPRFLHFENIRGQLTVNTAGNIRGHSAAAEASAVAATPVAAAYGISPNPRGPFPNPFIPSNRVERFSSDGPRRVFFEQDGAPITPGNFLSSGGRVRQKPDLTAADGVTTTLPPGSGLNPFYGTSAAAPHAAAIAALVKSFRPNLTAAQIRTALTSSAIDIESTGIDRDAGHGIIMANRALASLFESFSVSVIPSPLGGGTAAGGGIFEPNSTVTVTATPASGFRFVSWTEGSTVVSSTATYTFTITADRMLVANFAPAPRMGAYFGLITSMPALHETSGEIRIALTSAGNFTASLIFGGRRSVFRGRFNIAGQYLGVVRRVGAEPLQVELMLDGFGGSIIGFVKDSTNVTSVVAERAAFDARINPAPQTGRYTVISRPADPFQGSTAFPQGIGAGVMLIDKAGRVRIAKTLGDGTKVLHASMLSANGSWPFYVAPYRKQGSMVGFIHMEDKTQSDADGTVNWFKPPLPKDPFYPAGFNMQSIILVSRYTAPWRYERILPFPDGVDNGLFTIDGGNLNPAPEPKRITLTWNNKVFGPIGDRFRLQFVTKTGVFTGAFIAPGTNRSKGFVGVVFQKQRIGAGWFRGYQAVGSVVLSESPTTSSSASLGKIAIQ